MAPGLGARFGGLRRPLLSTGWRRQFRIRHGVRCPLAKDVERRNRTVLSVLANKLRLMGPAFPGTSSGLWLARLESWLALGHKTASRHCVCALCGCDLHYWVLRSNRAVGLGQSEIDGLGILSRSEEHTSELQSLRHLVCR